MKIHFSVEHTWVNILFSIEHTLVNILFSIEHTCLNILFSIEYTCMNTRFAVEHICVNIFPFNEHSFFFSQHTFLIIHDGCPFLVVLMFGCLQLLVKIVQFTKVICYWWNYSIQYQCSHVLNDHTYCSFCHLSSTVSPLFDLVAHKNRTRR